MFPQGLRTEAEATVGQGSQVTSGAGSRTWQRPRTAAARLEDARPRGSRSPARGFRERLRLGSVRQDWSPAKGPLAGYKFQNKLAYTAYTVIA